MERHEAGEPEYSIPLVIMRPRRRPVMPVSVRDWDNFIERVKSCQVSSHPKTIIASVAFTVGVTAGFSIIPIAYGRLPGWVTLVYVVFCVAGLVAGITLAVVQRELAHDNQARINALVADMEAMKAEFVDPDGG